MCGVDKWVLIKTLGVYTVLQVGLTLLLFYTMFVDKDIKMRIIASLVYSVPVALVAGMVVFFILNQRYEDSMRLNNMADSIF